MREISPCKGCTDRHTACHGSCEAYLEWRNRFQAQQAHFEANKDRWNGPWTAAGEKRNRRELKFSTYGYKYGGSQ